jgi:curli production assembly/transport component CsgF
MSMKNSQLPVCLGLLGACLLAPVQATELVYTPINPAFGGSPLNGPWLLANAQAQNDHEDPDLEDRLSNAASSPLQRFTSQLESRLLSQLLGNIQSGNTGSLTTDAFIIDMADNDGVLSIMITDRVTGEVSEIVVDGL